MTLYHATKYVLSTLEGVTVYFSLFCTLSLREVYLIIQHTSFSISPNNNRIIYCIHGNFILPMLSLIYNKVDVCSGSKSFLQDVLTYNHYDDGNKTDKIFNDLYFIRLCPEFVLNCIINALFNSPLYLLCCLCLRY